jgi:hypothetical protein
MDDEIINTLHYDDFTSNGIYAVKVEFKYDYNGLIYHLEYEDIEPGMYDELNETPLMEEVDDIDSDYQVYVIIEPSRMIYERYDEDGELVCRRELDIFS